MPTNLLVLRQESFDLLRRGEVNKATELLQTAIDRDPDQIDLYHELADIWWTTYDFGVALATYDEAYRRQPHSVTTCLAAARKLFGVGRFSESAAWLERARENAPHDPLILTMQAEVYDRCNRLDQAVVCAQSALNLAPGNPKAVRILAHLENRQGSPDQAVQRLRHRLGGKPCPEDWRLRYELATLLDQQGQYRTAMEVLLLAKAQLRERAQPYLSEARAIQFRQRELAQALGQADFESWRSVPIANPRSIAFLAGHPRSGTTLLEQMLGAHGQVITTDETGVLLREFIQPLLRDSGSVAESIHELRGWEPDQIEAGRVAYLRFTEAHLGEVVGASHLIEKDPALTPDLPLALRLFPEGRILFPLRDPRDVCISYFFTLVPLAATSAVAIDLRSTVEACAHSLAMWTHWKRVLPFPFLETRYERLVVDPELEMRRVLEFLGLPWTPSVLEFTKRSVLRGVRTPTYADVFQSLHRRAIGRWRNYQEYLGPHLHLLEPHLRTFGFDS